MPGPRRYSALMCDKFGLAFDVCVVHLGTLVAVLIYFRPKSRAMVGRPATLFDLPILNAPDVADRAVGTLPGDRGRAVCSSAKSKTTL